MASAALGTALALRQAALAHKDPELDDAMTTEDERDREPSFCDRVRLAWFGSTVVFAARGTSDYDRELYRYYPWTVALLVLAQVVFFLAWQLDKEGSIGAPALERPAGPPGFHWRLFGLSCERLGGSGPAIIVYEDLRDQAAYRIFTYGLVHTGWAHQLSNAVVQIYLGMPLETVHGPYMGALMLLSLVGGALTGGFLNPLKGVVGSSAMSYGLVGAHVSNIIVNVDSMDLGAFLVRAGVLAVMVIIEFAPLAADSGEVFAASVAHTVHMGGCFTGFFFGLYLLRNISLERMVGRSTVATVEEWAAGFVPEKIVKRLSEVSLRSSRSSDIAPETPRGCDVDSPPPRPSRLDPWAWERRPQRQRPWERSISRATTQAMSEDSLGDIDGSPVMLETPRANVQGTPRSVQWVEDLPDVESPRKPGCLARFCEAPCCRAGPGVGDDCVSLYCTGGKATLPLARILQPIGLLGGIAFLIFGVAWIATHDHPAVPSITQGSSSLDDAWWNPYNPDPLTSCS